MPDTIHKKILAISDEIVVILEKLNGSPRFGSQARYFSIRRIQAIARSIEGCSEAPSESQLQQIRQKTEELKAVVKQINQIIEVDIPNLNKILNEHNIPHLPLKEPIRMNLKEEF